jgi:predicted ester cyclase
MKKDPQELVSGFFDRVWNHGDFGYIDAHYSPDFVLHALWHNASLGRSGDASGPELAKQVIERWRAAFPDIHVTIEEQFVDGDIVVTRHLSSGTHMNDFNGILATGRRGEMSGITITRVAEDRIVEAWTCWDALGLLRQLGVIPTPGAAPVAHA